MLNIKELHENVDKKNQELEIYSEWIFQYCLKRFLSANKEGRSCFTVSFSKSNFTFEEKVNTFLWFKKTVIRYHEDFKIVKVIDKFSNTDDYLSRIKNQVSEKFKLVGLKANFKVNQTTYLESGHDFYFKTKNVFSCNISL